MPAQYCAYTSAIGGASVSCRRIPKYFLRIAGGQLRTVVWYRKEEEDSPPPSPIPPFFAAKGAGGAPVNIRPRRRVLSCWGAVKLLHTMAVSVSSCCSFFLLLFARKRCLNFMPNFWLPLICETGWVGWLVSCSSST